METELKYEELGCWQQVFSEKLLREETVEAVVPDTMPDVEQILDADARVCLKSKEAENGRLTATGTLEGVVVYRSEEGKLCRLEMKGGCSWQWEADELSEKDRQTVRLHLSGKEARLLNPRKVLLRAEIAAEADSYREGTLRYAADAEGEKLRKRLSRETVCLASGVEEKSFVIAEEFLFPAAMSAPEEILMSRVSAVVEDVRSVAGKMVLQGSVELAIFYIPEGENMPRLQSFNAPFSQIMDAPEELSDCSVTLTPTAVYVETLPGGYSSEGVSLELHVLAQAVAYTEKEIEYLCDAYSTSYPAELKCSEWEVCSERRSLRRKETIRQTVETAEAVSEVLWCYAVPLPAEAEDNAVTLPVSVHVFYLTENGTLSAVQGTFRTDRALLGEEESPEPGEVLCRDCYAAAAGRGIELRLGVEWSGSCQRMRMLRSVEEITLIEDSPLSQRQRPSVTAVRRENTELWELAKRYGSTTELIEEANPGAAEQSGFLLIPLAR